METPECPECGTEMEFWDSYYWNWKKGIIVDEYICPNCLETVSNEPPED